MTKTGVISASLGVKNSTVFPIQVRLWNFFSVLRRLGGLELELQAIRDQGDKFGVRRFPLGVAHGVAKEALRGVPVLQEKHLRLVIVGSITLDCRSGQPDPMSEAFLQMAGMFSQLELSMIRMRVRSGMTNARAKGKQIGKPQVTVDSIPAIFLRHYPAYRNGVLNVSELARVCGASRTTVYKYIGLLEA